MRMCLALCLALCLYYVVAEYSYSSMQVCTYSVLCCAVQCKIYLF